MLSMKYRIIQKQLRLIGKTMNKDKENLFRQALIAGRKTCNGEDLLTKFIHLCKDLDLKYTFEGNHNKKNIRNVVWREK